MKELQRFFCMCNHYRIICQVYAMIAEPLSGLASNNVKYDIGLEKSRAFSAVKKLSTSVPVLKDLIRTHGCSCTTMLAQMAGSSFETKTRGQSNRHCGVFFLANNGNAKTSVLCYENRVLRCSGSSKKNRHFLCDKEFYLFTDHYSLKWLGSSGMCPAGLGVERSHCRDTARKFTMSEVAKTKWRKLSRARQYCPS